MNGATNGSNLKKNMSIDSGNTPNLRHSTILAPNNNNSSYNMSLNTGRGTANDILLNNDSINLKNALNLDRNVRELKVMLAAKENELSRLQVLEAATQDDRKDLQNGVSMGN